MNRLCIQNHVTVTMWFNERKRSRHLQSSLDSPDVCHLFLRVIANMVDRTLYDKQLRERACFLKGFRTMGCYTHTITGVIEVPQKNKKPLCIAFTDLNQAFHYVDTEVVIEALSKSFSLYKSRFFASYTRIQPPKSPLSEKNASECCVYLHSEVNMMNDIALKLRI
ncbi:hypothetical protein DICVIV_07627 [Dictyocaulus viviparus]|uniref:Reverse transcriptase domain-containing protein n=1 Tax=Dictyocaulus viviparus TaxID=29172 RepID=A0A0D8XRE9_DICVI|nr:hypothetical protein DICVIV_07627 [Dictyocaulus viviparus]